MKKILNLICLLALCQSHGPPLDAKEAARSETKEEKQVSSREAAITPLTFPQYKKAVSEVNLKDHTISLEGLEKALEKSRGKSLEKSNLVILDLRDAEDYKEGHIKGAISFGADISKERLEKFVPDKKTTVILYCTNNFFPTRRVSLNFASLPQVLTAGYPHTFILEDLWQSEGFAAVDKFKAGPLWQIEAKSAATQ